MSLRRTGRRCVTVVTVALCGCNLNPHGEDPGFEDAPGVDGIAGDEGIDQDLPAGEGNSTPEMPAGPAAPQGLGDDPQGIIDEPAPGEPPAPRPSEPPPVDSEDDASADPIGAGTLPDGGRAELEDAGASRVTDSGDIPTRPAALDAGAGAAGDDAAQRADAEPAPGADPR